MPKIFPLPVNYFSIVLGLSGLGLAWRSGASVGLLPALPGEVLLLCSAAIWVFLTGAYFSKWLRFTRQASAELHNMIQCCFISLLPISTILMGVSLLPYQRTGAWVFLLAGIGGQLVFAAYRSAGLWRGTHDAAATTPIIYLPTVATNFVSASALGSAGHTEIALFFFGAGMLSWLSVEPAILHRLRTMLMLDKPLRPALGIQLAPPFVGGFAYLNIHGGAVDAIAIGLIGYGVLQFIFLLRLLPWIWEGGFTTGFWAFSFGLASMAGCGLRLVAQYGEHEISVLGWGLFLAGTLLILLLAVLTLLNLFRFLFSRTES